MPAFCAENIEKHKKKQLFSSFNFQFPINCLTFAPANEHRGVEQLVARQAHNLEVARSSRAPATKGG